MRKVSVGASVAHAYEFLFGRFFQIIGTAWLPAALFAAGYYYYLTGVLPLLSQHPGDAAAMTAACGLVLASFAAFVLIHAVIAISLTQEALGVRKDLTLAHFVIGPRELRLFFGYLRYYVVFILVYALVLAVSLGAIFAAKKYGAGLAPNLALHGTPIAVVAAMILTVVLIVTFVLSMLRLFFLLAPVASVEHRTRLSRAWALTKGSSVRVFIIILLTCIPAMIGAVAAIYYLIGPADVAALFKAVQGAKRGDVSSTFLSFYAAHAVVLAAVAGALAVINGALLAGSSANAYRVASGHEDPEAEDDAALVAPLVAPVVAEEPAHDHGHGGHGDDDHGHGGHGHEDHGDEADDEASDDHGHGGDEEHGHDAHGHDGHAHDGHGDAEHGGHDAHGHGHDAHGHDAHGHDGHGHDDHGHHAHGDVAHGDDAHGHGDQGPDGHHAHTGDDNRDAA